MHTLVLLRHGESIWNKENRFTGWTDVGLTPEGESQARWAGDILKSEGYMFDEAHTSVLSRAIKTLWIALERMDLMWIPVHHSWRLNERHYGALQGLNKAETSAAHGEDQVFVWRRSYDVPPPSLDRSDERFAGRDPRYANVDPDALPLAESLANTVTRFLPYWHGTLAPVIASGRKVLIAAHGNSLRALVKHLDNISDEDIPGVNIPTGIPLVYRLDKDLSPLESFYLGDPEKAAAAARAVAEQGKAKA